MPCRKCDDLKSKYVSALDRLRQVLSEFEQISDPSLSDIERLEQRRRAVDQAVQAFRVHLVTHGDSKQASHGE